MKIPSLTQLQTSLEQINDNTKNYIRSIQETAEGLQFLDGNGNVVYELLTTIKKQSPNLILDKYSLEDNVESDTVIATYDGDGTLSVQSASDPFWCYYNYTVNGNQINFELKHDKDHLFDSILREETYIVTLSETDSYQSDTATVTVVLGHKFDIPDTT